MARIDLPLTSGRHCDDCSACCTVMAVHELEKSNWSGCPHVCSGGCSIYEQRPGSCRTFDCLWLQGLLSDRQEHRPDRLGLVFTTLPVLVAGQQQQALVAMEVRAGARHGKKARKVLQDLTARRIEIVIAKPDRTAFVYRTGQPIKIPWDEFKEATAV